MRRALCAVCSLLILTVVAFAQSDRATITGTVSDPAGAVVPGAAIEAKNIDTRATYTAGTSTTGNFTMPELPTGNYELTVTVTGFKRYVKQNVFLPVAQIVRIDVVLQVGATSDTVTVTDVAPILKTESGELSHNVQTDRINNLPVLPIGTGAGGMRNPYAITNLLPGSSFTADAAVRINGLPSNTYSLRLEGQDAQTGIFTTNQSWTQPSVDAVQEVSIQTSNYAAEFGQAGGGVFNTTMKSGTNQYHGSAYDYMANEFLNAGTPNTVRPNDPTQHIRSRQRRQDYGFTVGGPVFIPKIYDGHDKTFFFFNFEQYRETQQTAAGTANGIKTVPTEAMRNGDFSAVLGKTSIGKDQLGNTLFNNQVFDPCSTQTDAATGIRFRTPFPGNKVPLGAAACAVLGGGTYLDPVAAKVQDLMPHQNVSVGDNTKIFQNYFVSYTDPKRQTVPSFKIDQNLSSKAKLSGYWGRTSVQDPLVDGMPFPITGTRGSDIVTYTSRLNFDYTLQPTMLLHIGIGLLDTDYLEVVAPLGDQFDVAKYFGLKGTGTTQLMWTINSLSNGNFGGYGQRVGPSTQIDIRNLKPTANTSMTWVKNNHTFKFGGELVVDGFINTSNTYAEPWINFNAESTATPASEGVTLAGGSSGFIYASFLLGMAHDGYTSVPNKTRLGKHALAGFAQDTWKVTRKLTIDYGLRYDFQTYLKEHQGYQGEIGFHTPNPGAGGRLGGTIFEATCNCAFAHNYPFAWGPRFGMAYQITPKTVVRAGAGISYTRTPADNFQSYAVASNTPYLNSQFGDPAYELKNGLPYKVSYPNLDPGQLPVNGVPTNILNNFDRSAGRPARTAQWSFFIQRELSRDLVVEVGYVGNRGAWFQSTSGKNDNALSPEGLLAQGIDIHTAAGQQLLRSQLRSPTAIAAGFGGLPYVNFPNTRNVEQALLPFPEYTTLLNLWSPLGSTKYDSLQTNVTKRFSHGVEFNTNFTWSKQLENGVESEGLGAGTINDVFNHNQNWYLSSSDQPYLLVVSGSYTTPKTPGAGMGARVLSQAVRDWQLGTVLRYGSGLLITTPSSINQLNTLLNRGTLYNRVAGPAVYLNDLNSHSYDPSQTLVLNPAAWQDPGQGNWGTAAARYSDYRSARRPSESLSLGRNFRMREGKMNLQIRAEFQNAFNRWIWPNPTGTPSTPVTHANASDPTSPLTGGYGFINLAGGGAGVPPPRAGTLVARFTF